MKNLFFLFVLATSITTISRGQQDHTLLGFAAEDNLRALGTSRTANSVRLFNNRYQGVRGSPFLNDQWAQSEIVLTKGDTVHTLLKVDIYSDNIWAIMPSGDSIIVDKGLVKSFWFIDNTIKRQRQFFFDPHALGYYEMLYQGRKFSLVCQRKKDLNEAVISGAYTTGNPYDEFVPAKTQYYVIFENKLHPLRLKRSNIIDVLGSGAKMIMLEKEFDLKVEKDLVELVKAVDDRQGTQQVNQ